MVYVSLLSSNITFLLTIVHNSFILNLLHQINQDKAHISKFVYPLSKLKRNILTLLQKQVILKLLFPIVISLSKISRHPGVSNLVANFIDTYTFSKL